MWLTLIIASDWEEIGANVEETFAPNNHPLSSPSPPKSDRQGGASGD